MVLSETERAQWACCYSHTGDKYQICCHSQNLYWSFLLFSTKRVCSKIISESTKIAANVAPKQIIQFQSFVKWFLDKQVNIDGSCFRAGFGCFSGGGTIEKDISSDRWDSCVLAQNVTQSPEAFEWLLIHDGNTLLRSDLTFWVTYLCKVSP